MFFKKPLNLSKWPHDLQCKKYPQLQSKWEKKSQWGKARKVLLTDARVSEKHSYEFLHFYYDTVHFSFHFHSLWNCLSAVHFNAILLTLFFFVFPFNIFYILYFSQRVCFVVQMFTIFMPYFAKIALKSNQEVSERARREPCT